VTQRYRVICETRNAAVLVPDIGTIGAVAVPNAPNQFPRLSATSSRVGRWLVEPHPGWHGTDGWLAHVLRCRDGTAIVDGRCFDAELCRQLFQPRRVTLSPAPNNHVPFCLPLGVAGHVGAGTYRRSLPVSATAAGTRTRRVKSVLARAPLQPQRLQEYFPDCPAEYLDCWSVIHPNLP
jgi:hypothetical protein